MDFSAVLTTTLAAVVIASLGVLTGVVLSDFTKKRREQTNLDLGAEFTELRATLDRLQATQATKLDTAMASQNQFLLQTAESLRQDTSRLVRALSRSEVRGQWGEMQLRRLVESAGMLERVHFTEQDTVHTDDARLRPDMIVHLSADRLIVVDAKVPLDAILSADENTDPAELRALHTAAVSSHIDRLSKKEYWKQYDTSPDFVVMFLPSESLLAEALYDAPELMDYAFSKRIVLATPTSLLAMLRTIAHVWQAESLSANAAEIQQLGQELYERLGTVNDHLGKLGKALKTSVDAYNAVIGSFETRLVVSARKIHDHGVGRLPIESPAPVTNTVRNLQLPATDDSVSSIRAL